MDQKKVGAFMKELRKEKGITQEALAEILGVTGRTISRWETGSNMPDLDILIQVADYYEVEIREILDGERKSEKMNKELEETVLKVADYSNEEKMRLIKKLHVFSWIGVISFVIFLLLESMGLADSGYTETIASFCGGLAFGILMITVIYTSRYISKFQAFKRRLLKRQ
ncbi:MAG: helix-turn-helix domain-containing protein [Lachnospiraceae bacterium]|nr:helix-turn-helix domain-containing protein [Lachnospiraceae bacterium]